MKQTDTEKALVIIVGLAIAGAFGTVLAGRGRPAPGFSPAPSASAAAQATATDAVEIGGFAYGPGTVTVKVGTTVTWTNRDTVNHTVTSESGTELDSPKFGRDGTYAHTFARPGTYAYYCEPHPYMKGTVIVTE